MLVRDVMQRHLKTIAGNATVGPHTSVADAAALMLQRGTQHVFVEDDGALVGVVTLTDIARTFARTAA